MLHSVVLDYDMQFTTVLIDNRNLRASRTIDAQEIYWQGGLNAIRFLINYSAKLIQYNTKKQCI